MDTTAPRGLDDRLSIMHCLVIVLCIAFYTAISLRVFGDTLGPWQCFYAIQDGTWLAAIAFLVKEVIQYRSLKHWSPGHWILVCVALFHLLGYPFSAFQIAQSWPRSSTTHAAIVLFGLQALVCFVAAIRLESRVWKVIFVAVGTEAVLNIHLAATFFLSKGPTNFSHVSTYVGLATTLAATIVLVAEAVLFSRRQSWLHWVPLWIYASTAIPTIDWIMR